MAQAINLQITPSNVMPKIYASQFDIGREIEIILYDGASAYTPPVGTDIRFEGKKPDGNGFSYACTYTGNVVTIVTTAQMTVLAGEIPCELRMSLNGNDLGTLNIIFVIEKSPIDENVPMSDTEIPAIVELARDEQYTAEAWATGERNGVPVGPTDPQYHNNAKYWAEHAEYGALDDLTDVEITTPSDGDFLQFNGANNKWANTHDEVSAIENMYGSKNLHRITKVYVGNTGITWSMDENGVITLNGTASGNWTLFMTANSSTWSYSDGTVGLLRKGTYKLVNKGANNKNDNTCFMGLVVIKSDGTSAADIDTTSGDVTNDFTIDGDNYSYISYIRITNGTTVNNVKFYPMIVDARITDLTFASSAPTNRDCMSYTVNTKLGAHNFLKNAATTQTINGITFTVNYDGSVTANGTASANANLRLIDWTNKAFPEGQLVISDDIADHTGAYTYVDAKKGSGTVSTIANTKNHPDFSINYATYDTFYVAIWVTSGTVLSNVTFKPMVRLASDTDTTYSPHVMTNMQLTEEILGGKIYNFGTSDAGTNVTFLKAQAIKMGDIVFLTGSWVGNNTNVQPIFTVPTDLRPKKSGYVVGAGSGERNDNSMSISGQYILNSSGELSQSLSTTPFKEGSFTFIYSISKS